MALNEVVQMMKGDAWPAGYQPLAVVGAVVENGLQKKNIRWLNGLCVTYISSKKPDMMSDQSAAFRQKVADDPHTRMCFSDQSGGMYVVYEYELNDSYGKEQQARYYSRVQHFGMDYYARLTDCEADHTLVGVTKPIPLCRDPEVYYNAEALTFHADDISGKPPDKQGSGGDKWAKPSEIRAWLANRVKLRRNMMTGRVEYSDYLGASTDDIWFDVWKAVDDVWLNTKWMEMADEQPVKFEHLQRVVKSDFATPFHPFRVYLESLPKWDGKSDGIRALSMSVQVKGADGTWNVDEQDLFYRMLKKWLVGMVAGWLDDEEVNSSILVLLGRQGSYKTTWFNFLLPPELRHYFYTKIGMAIKKNDDILMLSKSALVCLEELDTMTAVETNNMKTVSTMRFSDVRQAYDHFAEHRKLIASYCGTGNNIQFLNDPSGNRRWLPFEVESITSPRDVPFDYAAIYSQSYALYREGYEYYFSEVENDFINERNKERFSIPDPEAELVEEYFRKPTDKNPGIFVTSSDAADIVSTASRHIKPAAIGRALSRLGFESDRKGNRRGYYVVIVDYDERKREAASLAYDAMLRRSKANSPSDKPKTADTSNMPDAF